MDCLVIGAGLSGSVIARYLAENHKKQVCVWERRAHIGGNMYDYVDKHHIRVQKYGPHIFHTNSKDLFSYMQQYVEMTPFDLTYNTYMEGIYTDTPFNFKTIDDFYTKSDAQILKERIRKYFGNKSEVSILELLESTDILIKEYAEFLYEKDYKPYTSKQWGIPANEIDPSILERVKIKLSYSNRFFDDIYQAVPYEGYQLF